MTDKIIPIAITPKPDALERVLVGKTEIIKPSFEQALVSYYKKNGNLDTVQYDRYHVAYLQRVQQLLKEGVSETNAMTSVRIIPNPASSPALRGPTTTAATS